ncbi:glycosyltransferase [Vibrio sp. 1S139]|uniref:glycosyltransferase n=1 Tax=Vibrio sp. 1S139 TaxID=3230006 RepID=UPI00352C5D45
MLPSVVAIVVTYKRPELLEKVLHAVLNQSHTVCKLLIVDNNSSDSTCSVVEKFSRVNDVVEYHNTGDNLGGAGGFRRGFELAKDYDYTHLWLMDDDFLPSETCLEELLKVNNKSISQPMRFNLDGTCAEISPVQYDLSNPFVLNPKRQTVLDLSKVQCSGAPFDLDGVPFEGPLISKSVVDSVGFPEPEFFIFYDDLDFSLRARKKGFEIHCVPNATATRLLINNQKDDLKSWKGYFMLRNLFYVHYAHGNNLLVKAKPLVIALGYGFLSLIKRDFGQLNTVYNAYKDSFNLGNTKSHRPGARG